MSKLEMAQFEIDGQEVSAERREVLGRATYRLKIKPNSQTLFVYVSGQKHIFGLRPRANYPAITKAQEYIAANEIEKAIAALASLTTAKDLELRARALSTRARAYLRAGRLDEATRALHDSYDAAVSAGLPVLAVRELFSLAHLQMQDLFELADAESTLGKVQPTMAIQFGQLAYHQAALALLRGTPRTALEKAREAVRIGEQLSDLGFYSIATQMELMLLAELGRLSDARSLAAKLESDKQTDPCADALIKTNVGWMELVAVDGDPSTAKRKSEEAVSLYRSRCPDRFMHQNALINVALAEFRLNDLSSSREHLESASTLLPLAGWVKAWAVELEGRLLLSAGDAKGALRVFQELRAKTAISAPVSSRYRAAVGAGLAFKRLGDVEHAVQAFYDAEQELDADARLVPIAEGRDVFVGEREESSRELIDTLLTAKRPEEALLVARRARARAVRTLNVSAQAQALNPHTRARWLEATGRYKSAKKKLERSEESAWEVPANQREAFLRTQAHERATLERALDDSYALLSAGVERPLVAPKAGELILAFYPLPRGWVAFAATTKSVLAQRIDTLAIEDRAALSRQLLAPFKALIDDAQELRILAYGPLKDVPIHTLPYANGVLLEYKSVVYAVDLGEVGVRAQHFQVPVAVIADPRNDLPLARQEGASMAQRLLIPSQHQWMGERATRGAVSEVLSTTRFVHYAGHAEADARGTHSRMLLAGAEELDVGDLLMLEGVPQVVVLSGCETMLEPSDAPVASLGLAQALILRGAELVIATTSRVPDEFGLELASRLYAGEATLPGKDRVRQALLSAREAGDASWESYRILVP